MCTLNIMAEWLFYHNARALGIGAKLEGPQFFGDIRDKLWCDSHIKNHIRMSSKFLLFCFYNFSNFFVLITFFRIHLQIGNMLRKFSPFSVLLALSSAELFDAIKQSFMIRIIRILCSSDPNDG